MPADAGLSTMLRKGVLPNLVLALIAGRPRYGLEIVRALRDAGLVNGEGTVYPMLARLREEGVVTTEWRETGGGPPRRYYEATGDGREQLAAFRRTWFAFVASVDGILEEEAGPWSTARTR